jgi:Vesicle coat complex, various subunits
MIYLYLGNYAESNSELAFMAINTYLKDLDNADGKIRGLALRSLFNLRFQGVLEYLPSALVKGLNDLDPYVKKTAIMACVKYFYLTGAKIDASKRFFNSRRINSE